MKTVAIFLVALGVISAIAATRGDVHRFESGSDRGSRGRPASANARRQFRMSAKGF